MPIGDHRKKAIITLFAVLLTCGVFAQGTTKKMTDSIGLHSYVVLRGDTILIENDSSYLLNKNVFNLFHENYRRVQKGSPEMKRLLQNYEDIIALQDSMLQSKETYYQRLHTSYDSLMSASNQFVGRTDANIGSINQSLSAATENLNNIKSLLDTSLNQLKGLNRLKFKWAIGGFTVGIAAAAVMFLVAK